MGASDTVGEAESFAANYGGPPNLLWSESFIAWNHYRAGNPQLLLLDAAGATEIDRQSGFNQARLEDALADLA